MAINDYKAVANDGAANVVTQAAYLAALGAGGSIEHGYQAGTALSALVNKTLRQSSVMAAAVAQMISDTLGIDVNDDGNVATLTANLKAALFLSSWSTGDVKLTMKNVADVGWVLVNDGTIGNALSGGTARANADTAALFTLLWNNVSNTFAPVSAGRGANAAADYAANKTIGLTKMLGRALAIAGAGAGLTARALGENLGDENLQEHLHEIYTGNGAGVGAIGDNSGAALSLRNPTTPTGAGVNAGTGHSQNMQPTSFLNAMIKL